MKETIASNEAKTKFSEIMRSVQRGKSYVVTVRGKAVAHIVPAQEAETSRIQKAIAEMRVMASNSKPLSDTELKRFTEEGRD